MLNAEKLHPIEFDPAAPCNVTDETIIAQVNANIRLGLPQAQPHEPNVTTALLVCGGPSLVATEKELVQAVWDGGKIFAVNGAYQWCLEHNLKPSVMIMLDGREFNSRFVKDPVPGCRYLLASQCHPRTFELCRGRDVMIWHACSGGDKEVELLKNFYFDNTFPVPPPGTTVGVRAISLMRMIGFQNIETFGLDSCWLEGGAVVSDFSTMLSHHSYKQFENDGEHRTRVSVWLRPKGRDDKAQRFMCSPWHVKQAQDFMDLIKERGHMFRLNIHGDGLLAAIIRTGAEIQMEVDPPGP